MIHNEIATKKRLMYLSGQDFYLFCYSIFITLDALDCTNESVFRDYRKLAFLVNIINDDRLVNVISNSNNITLSNYDKEKLFQSYTDGLTKRSEILKLLFTLEKKQFVILQRGKNNFEIDVILNKDTIPDNFLNSEIFTSEYARLKQIKLKIKKLKSLTLDTMLKKLYQDNGVNTWAI